MVSERETLSIIPLSYIKMLRTHLNQNFAELYCVITYMVAVLLHETHHALRSKNIK